MPTSQIISIDYLSIHSLEEGEGQKIIFFIHGNSSNANSWLPQLQDKRLIGNYKLVAVDLPGHGQSSNATDYHMKALAGLIPQIVEQLSPESYIVVGISNGTCLIGEAATNLPAGCMGIVLTSSNIANNDCPPSTFLKPFPEIAAITAVDAPDSLIEAFAQRLVYNNPSVAKEYVASYKATDPAFRASLGEDVAASAWTDEFANLLSLKVPVCTVFGKEEKVIKTDYLDSFPANWDGTVFHVPEAGHFVNMEQPDAFNDILLQFSNAVFK